MPNGLARWRTLGGFVSAFAARLTRPTFTLRVKAILTLCAMGLYLVIFALYVAHDRAKLLYIAQQQEEVYTRQQALIRMNVPITHSILELQYVLSAGTTVDQKNNVLIDLSSIDANLPAMKVSNPDFAASIERFQRASKAAASDWSKANIEALRDREEDLNAQIEELEGKLAEQHVSLASRNREANRTIFIAWVVTSIIGVAIFGSLVTVFFTRLARDLKTLESRAVAIVGGYRGPALSVTRGDEVGGMMHAVNRMQSTLRDWEQQQELSRQQRFHQEKMAAVGSLAAAVAHEVTNPIAAIAGIAQHVLDADAAQAQAPAPGDLQCPQARMILAHAERITSIMRQIADVASQRSPRLETLDVNSHVAGICNFIVYDKRFRDLALTTNQGMGLPAVRVVADHLTQVLMNLLINAADAMENVRDRKPQIIVSTRWDGDRVVLEVRDNGCGMAPDILDQAFREFFTTKPAEKGRGIGLFLCKMLIEEVGGRVSLKSKPGEGTTASVYLPSWPGRSAP